MSGPARTGRPPDCLTLETSKPARLLKGTTVFKHILAPTDGSASSELAIQLVMRFARSIGARVTGVHVIPPFRVLTTRPDMLEDTPEQYAIDSEDQARRYLLTIEQYANECGVACDTFFCTSDLVHAAIVQAAFDRQCDLIAMASHGRSGLRGLLVGSETQKVLAHAQIPVLVFR